MPNEFVSQVFALLWCAPFFAAVYVTARAARMTLARSAVLVYAFFGLFQVLFVVALNFTGHLERSWVLWGYIVLSVVGVLGAVAVRFICPKAAVGEGEGDVAAADKWVFRGALAFVFVALFVKILFTPVEIFDVHVYHMPITGFRTARLTLGRHSVRARSFAYSAVKRRCIRLRC